MGWYDDNLRAHNDLMACARRKCHSQLAAVERDRARLERDLAPVRAKAKAAATVRRRAHAFNDGPAMRAQYACTAAKCPKEAVDVVRIELPYYRRECAKQTQKAAASKGKGEGKGKSKTARETIVGECRVASRSTALLAQGRAMSGSDYAKLAKDIRRATVGMLTKR